MGQASCSREKFLGEGWRRMLIATLRADNPHGGALLTYDCATDTFALEGFGEVRPAKLLDLANRQQLVWTNSSTRELVLRRTVASLGEEKAAQAAAREFAVEKAATARAAARAFAADVAANASVEQTKATAGAAASAKFEAPTETAHEGRRAGWSQPLGDEPERGTVCALQGASAPEKGTPDTATSRKGDRSRTAARRLWAGVVLAACLVVGGLGLAFPHELAHQLAISFTRQPTPYTELYFTDPQTIPGAFTVSGPNSFRFTVANHEGREYVYSYIITLASSYGVSTIERGAIDVGNGSSATKAVDFLPPKPDTQYVVRVSLLRPVQTIHFTGLSTQ